VSRGDARNDGHVPGASAESLLAAALQRLSTDGEAGLEAVCAQHGDRATWLRAEVARLRSMGLAGTVGASRAAPPLPAPGPFGPYDLIRRLGAGGMGEVFLARQHAPIERLVALKVMRADFADASARARFLAERQALARMQHDGIARVYEAGETSSGAPYLAMEYVEGMPLSRFCDERGSTVQQRLALLLRVCDAVQHAHHNGVIHRDLKPDNVLVTEQDGTAVPKLIDFGLAKELAPRDTGFDLTRTGLAVGTPSYMSPEQAAGDEVDTRTDVYSLGVILYELLTSRRPFERDGTTVLSFLRALRDDDPTRPSARVDGGLPEGALRARGGISRRALRRAIAGDLDWIALRALARDRTQRYASASELASDLRRHLAQRPVLAGPPRPGYVLAQFVRRHRLAVGAGLVIGAVLAVAAAREWRNWVVLRERDQRNARLSLGPRLREVAARGENETVNLLRPRDGKAYDVPALAAWLREMEGLLAEGTAVANAIAGAAPGERAASEVVLLDKLRADLSQFAKRGEALDRARRMLPYAASVEQATLEDAAAAWRDAIASIADAKQCPAYGGLALTPQLGLLPLRRDPATGLWEFRCWHPDGAPARWGADGRLEDRAAFDPVLVLLPGGTFLMGSGEGDPDATGLEKPAHAVTLAPFFLSKYELTAGQWFRWTGERPSERPAAHAVDDGHPVTNLDWNRCSTVLWDFGLRLPTEAQWEYGARAETQTPWWPGEQPGTLPGRANFADLAARTGGVTCPWYHDHLDDGWAWTAPVDALAANGFGLHHVHGNVWEWCGGAFLGNYQGVTHRPGNGLIVHPSPPDTGPRLARGGSFMSNWLQLRSAARLVRPREAAAAECGLRPARPLIP
jgi:serine/threonine protein kinase/formylglycine-generating enzyme required for sulfatase activity